GTVGEAIWQLRSYRDVSVIDVLIGKLNDSNFAARFGKEITKTLNYITGKEYAKDYEKWRQWWRKNRAAYMKKQKERD
ncbi:MAG: hypothetical protein GY757_48810, partial [bacterium]|nr:hypothetical protein [bacterium]